MQLKNSSFIPANLPPIDKHIVTKLFRKNWSYIGASQGLLPYYKLNTSYRYQDDDIVLWKEYSIYGWDIFTFQRYCHKRKKFVFNMYLKIDEFMFHRGVIARNYVPDEPIVKQTAKFIKNEADKLVNSYLGKTNERNITRN